MSDGLRKPVRVMSTDEMAARIEELEAQLAAIEEYGTEEINEAVALRQKLAKALVALEITDHWLRDLGMYANPDYHLVPSLQTVRTTLAELKGMTDDQSSQSRP